MSYTDLSRKARPDGRIDKLIDEHQKQRHQHIDLSEQWLKYANTIDDRFRHWQKMYDSLEKRVDMVDEIAKKPPPPTKVVQPVYQTVHEPCKCKCAVVPDSVNAIPDLIRRIAAVEETPAIEHVTLVSPPSHTPRWPLAVAGAWLLFLTYAEVFNVFGL